MLARRPGPTAVAFAFLVAAAAATAPSPALACTCIPTDLASIYAGADAVLRVRVLAERTRNDTERIYAARVRTSYKGCVPKGQRIQLVTGIQGGTCGVTLEVGREYVVSGARRPSGRAFDIGLCGFQRPFDALAPAETDFLDSRQECCDGECRCVNSELVQCIVDPCEVATCPEGTCTANYCGGCRAEFFDDEGAPVCQPCESDAGCRAFDQRCDAEGRCVASCETDAHCGGGDWCAPKADGTAACRPLQALGAPCGGEAADGTEQRCADGLFCEPRDLDRPELGSRCRRSCTDADDCPSRQYCAPSLLTPFAEGTVEPRICRRDGTCTARADCFESGNTFPVPLCTGSISCEARRCGMRCGPSCEDVAGIDFGSCLLLLGYAPRDGVCVPIGGCSRHGQYFHPEIEGCRQACEE